MVHAHREERNDTNVPLSSIEAPAKSKPNMTSTTPKPNSKGSAGSPRSQNPTTYPPTKTWFPTSTYSPTITPVPTKSGSPTSSSPNPTTYLPTKTSKITAVPTESTNLPSNNENEYVVLSCPRNFKSREWEQESEIIFTFLLEMEKQPDEVFDLFSSFLESAAEKILGCGTLPSENLKIRGTKLEDNSFFFFYSKYDALKCKSLHEETSFCSIFRAKLIIVTDVATTKTSRYIAYKRIEEAFGNVINEDSFGVEVEYLGPKVDLLDNQLLSTNSIQISEIVVAALCILFSFIFIFFAHREYTKRKRTLFLYSRQGMECL